MRSYSKLIITVSNQKLNGREHSKWYTENSKTYMLEKICHHALRGTVCPSTHQILLPTSMVHSKHEDNAAMELLTSYF